MIQHRWFRVEQAADGSILSCAEVDAKGRKGGTVRFYSAVDASAACALAKEWYANWRAQAAARTERYMATRRSRGMCAKSGCTRGPRAGKTMCQECTDAQRAQRRARRARHRQGDTRDLRLHPGGPQGVRDAYLANSATAAATRTRRRHLQILRKLDELSPGEALAFRAWLVSKIPAMQQTQGEWHPPLVEPMAEAAE